MSSPRVEVRAAVLRDVRGPFQIEALAYREPVADQVLVKIVGVGMCHTDLSARRGRGTLPLVAGHEGAGVVEAIGPAVTDVSVGDHVVLSFGSCGSCRACVTGQPALCDHFLEINFSGTRDMAVDAAGDPVTTGWFGQSSFATHAISRARNLVVVDEDLPLELVGPLGCGVLTGAGAVLSGAKVPAGSSVSVLGSGAVGLAAVMAARLVGSATIVAVDVKESRRAMALELGATHVVDGNDPDVVGRVTDATGGVDYAFDTTGVPSVVADAVRTLRPGGFCGLIGMPTGPSVLDASVLMGGRRVGGLVEGLSVPRRLVPLLLELWQQGRFPFDRLIQTFPLEDINEAEQASLSGEVIKPVLLPNT